MQTFRCWVYGFAGLLLIQFATSARAVAVPVVVIGAEDDAAPWSYADGTGYVNDVVLAALKRAGWTAQLKVMPYARCKAMVLAGSLAACFSASKTSELAGKLLYPRHAVFDAQNILFARPESALSGCDPSRWPRRPTIGTVRGYEYAHSVGDLIKSGQAHGDESDSEVSNLRKIAAGRLDATLVTVDTVKRIEFVAAQAKVGSGFKIVCNFGGESAYVAFSPLHPQGAAALQAFDLGYAKLLEDGSISTLQQHWRTRLLDSIRAKKH